MRPTDPMTEKLWRIAEPVCTGAGYELVDMSLVQSRRGWVLRVFIDHLDLDAMVDTTGIMGGRNDMEVATGLDHSTIGLADCERVSRELSVALDVEDLIEQAYDLEVSSPGLDRPLRTAAHFERHIGAEVKITLHEGVNGRRNFKGELVAAPSPADTAFGAEPGAANDERGDSPSPDGGAPDEALMVVVVRVDGVDHELQFQDIARAHLVPDWNALFNASQRELQKGRKELRTASSKAKTVSVKAAGGGREGNG